MATIIIPTPLRKFTNQESRLNVGGNTVKESIDELTLNFPELKKNLIDDDGRLRSFVNIFVGDDDIRDLQQENTVVNADSLISIIPAIAGGSPDSDYSEVQFSKEELERYNRHIIIPGFGLEAQQKLKDFYLFLLRLC